MIETLMTASIVITTITALLSVIVFVIEKHTILVTKLSSFRIKGNFKNLLVVASMTTISILILPNLFDNKAEIAHNLSIAFAASLMSALLLQKDELKSNNSVDIESDDIEDDND
jgi:hypothetical protein